MQSPLPIDTVLQSRYRLLELMAEGGFARTYLAEDQGRFNERCVVKEFFSSATDATVFKKAKELFQREAQTLYTLKHDQVPTFRGLFTTESGQDRRLFLVQDYVAGQTYRSVFQERQAQNRCFSEAEVQQLLKSLLPVLSYIHGQGIIHRDISLENLILRSPDQTPVLIDFGVVKTVVSQLQQSQVIPSGTVVGKFGYAPIEQLQSGRAYPSSDLYSLGVCCLVLLTGQEPAQLFDDGAAVWNWRGSAQVSDAFADLLDQMVAHRPSERFGSAEEVLRSLYALENSSQTSSPRLDLTKPGQSQAQASGETSQIRTIAVASPAAVQDNHQRQALIPAVRGIPAQNSRTDRAKSDSTSKPNPFLMVLIGAVTAVLSAGLGWAVMQFSLSKNLRPQSSPVETRSPQPPSPTARVRYSETLSVLPGQTTTVQGSLAPKESQTYQISAAAGNRLSAQLSGGPTFDILHSDLVPLSADSQNVTSWRGTLPQSDTYYVRIQNDSNEAAQPFQLNLALAEPPPEPSASPSAEAAPTPSVPTPAAATSLGLTEANPDQKIVGQIEPNETQSYTVLVRAGQSLSVAVLDQASVTLTIRNLAGRPINNAQDVLSWESLLSESGAYQIDVVPVEPSLKTDFAIAVGLHQL